MVLTVSKTATYLDVCGDQQMRRSEVTEHLIEIHHQNWKKRETTALS